MPNLPASKLIKMLHPIPVTIIKPLQALKLYYIQTSSPKEERVNTACTIIAYKNVIWKCFAELRKTSTITEQTNGINKWENYWSLQD